MADVAKSKDAVVVDIKDSERLWNAAILRRNVDDAAEFMASEFRLVIGVEGQSLQVVSRELWLSALPRYVIHNHEITDMHISVWDNLAVSTLTITQNAEPLNDREISGNFLITDIWILRNGKWQVAERHSSRQEKAAVPVRAAFQAADKSR